jgi:hypothetical protein
MTKAWTKGATAVAALTLLTGLGGQTAGQTPPAARNAALQQLADCRKITAAEARLDCYDAAAAAFETAEAQGDIVVVDREQARAVRRQAFGFQLPSLSLFDKGGAPEPIDEVNLKIDSAVRDGHGKWTLVLEGGQVWRQIDGGELSRDPKPGMTARIKSAALGSYKLFVGGSMAIRVHRDN